MTFSSVFATVITKNVIRQHFPPPFLAGGNV
nr:MAG TPA: hypothetical protein [Caudoviricetes sp.]